MMWEGVYQSIRCCELPESFTTPCHSSIVPQVQIGVRPMARRMAAVSAMRPTRKADDERACDAPPELSAFAARSRARPSQTPAYIRPGLRMPAGSKEALMPREQAHQRLGLRLEHVDGRADLGRRAHEGRVAADRSVAASRMTVAPASPSSGGRDPDEPAAPVVEPLRVERLRDVSHEIGPFRRRGRDAPDRAIAADSVRIVASRTDCQSASAPTPSSRSMQAEALQQPLELVHPVIDGDRESFEPDQRAARRCRSRSGRWAAPVTSKGEPSAMRQRLDGLPVVEAAEHEGRDALRAWAAP